MSETSNIAWTRSTFNPWIGCTKVGPGCDGCYAEALDHRMKFGGATHWGAGVPRYRTRESNWRKPLGWNAKQASMLAGDPNTPPWRVFCASLADVFDNDVPQQWRSELFSLILSTPYLSWLLVTKRIGNVPSMAPFWSEYGFPPNVRLLITVVSQEEADRDIPKLLALPCENGISYEPALGPIDWSPWLCDGVPTKGQIDGERGAHYLRHGAPRLDWIIVGGESAQAGHAARRFNITWARDTVAQCAEAGVPVFVKQFGSTPYWDRVNGFGRWSAPYVVGPAADGSYGIVLKDRAGADPAEWPEDLQVREFPR